MKKRVLQYTTENNIYFEKSPTLFNQLVALIEKHPCSYGQMLKAKGKKSFIKKHPDYIPPYHELFNWINESIPLLNDEFYRISTKCYWILNGLTDFPSCSYDGCKYHFIHHNVQVNMPYPKFCVKHSKCDPSTIEKRKATCRKNYGVDFPIQSTIIKEKIKQTNLKNLGYASPLSSPVCIEKGKRTRYIEHGDENWHNSKKSSQTFKQHLIDDPAFMHKIREKIKHTNIKNGHDENWTNRQQAVQTRLQNSNGIYWTDDMYTKSENTKHIKRLNDPNYDEEIQSKIRNTNIERYGVSCVLQSDYAKKKLNEWILDHGGTTNAFQTDYAKEKSQQTMEKRYGAPHSMQSDLIKNKYNFKDINAKGNETKRKNGTFNTSKPEDESYELLCEKFGKDDVIRQYKSEKYPFNCDFYIKSIDTYIECNFNWTHGGHPFDPNSEEDQAQLQAWKDKDTKFYQVAIDVWTRRDPNKMKTALDNNLRFKVFWTIDDVNDWIMHLNIQ